MSDVIRKLFALLSIKERRQAFLLLGMILFMAFLDVVGIASIMPFMAVLANPEVVETNSYLRAVFTRFGFVDTESFLFFLGVVVFTALVISICFKALTTWSLMRFSQMRNYSIARRLVAGYLRQPYEWFLDRHSADLGKTVLSEVDVVVRNALMPLMHFLAQTTLVAAILIMLILVDPLLALIVGGGIGGAYGVTYAVLRRLLTRTGRVRLAANQQRFKAVSDAFGGIKEVKLGAMESDALNRFSVPARRFARAQMIAQLAAMMPRYALEIIAFGGMLLLVLVMMRTASGVQDALPIIALYALAGYRLMPALQASYGHATKLRFAGPALDQLHQDLEQASSAPALDSETPRPLVPMTRIQLRDVEYRYPGSQRPALKDLSLTIPARTTVGLVGATGSGKTTTVDIILGLLEPEKGQLVVDNESVLAGNRRAWQRSLGYVPQQIFLADDTVAANIAFGVPDDLVDMDAVERAATIANLHEFVVDDLPEGYETLIGERGVRLSGGQRQRIGIARALYHRPTVLVLDEATSALDNLTEQVVMEAVHNLGGEITIVLIAHRLTTVRECNCIFVMDQGKIIEEGTFEELSIRNVQFKSMTGA